MMGMEAMRIKVLRELPQGEEEHGGQEELKSPPGGSCSQPVSPGNFHTLTGTLVINSWSLTPSRGGWDEQRLLGDKQVP